GAGELLVAGCATSPRASSSDLASVPNVIVTVPEAAAAGRHDLRLNTTRPLYEPMYELRLELRCPGSPRVVRQYVLMLDLPGTRPESMPATTTTQVGLASVPPQARATRPTAGAAAGVARRAAPEPALSGATVYRVQRGDTLSTIAARIRDRGGRSIWEVADQIFASNPNAFINGNPDLIRSGVEIALPATLEESPAAQAAAPSALAAPPSLAPVTATQPDGGTTPPETAPVALAVAEVADEPVAEPLASTVLTEPATPAVFQDEQASVDVVAAAPPAPEVTMADPADGGTPPWLAALVGILIGTAASFLLLRERLVEALRGSRGTRLPSETSESGLAETLQPPKFGTPSEPSMVVVEGPRAEALGDTMEEADPTDRQPSLGPESTAEYADLDMPSELASLFDTGPGSRVSGPGAPDPQEMSLDLDLSAAAAEVEVDANIGWVEDLDETSLTATDRADGLQGSAGDTVEQTNLRDLSQQAIDEQMVSDTLKEALELLESDYEDELTASQMIDRAKLGEILDEDEDTLIRTGTDQIPRR
ncbi:MAG: hypothetical protein L6Q83_07075, partial [Gammaproteobacteria bacterium]|nr:hypothetical protein [Gammaproteobacteria bacterium]